LKRWTTARCPYRPVRHHFGITTFGATAWTAKSAGDRLLNEHDETDEVDELYLVLSGTARFELAGDTVQAPPGTFVHVAPGVMRTAFAGGAGTTILAVGGGREGEPTGLAGGKWEPRCDHCGRLAATRNWWLAPALLNQGPPYPELLYNVACSETLIGRTDDALDHLATRRRPDAPSSRPFARGDEEPGSTPHQPRVHRPYARRR